MPRAFSMTILSSVKVLLIIAPSTPVTPVPPVTVAVTATRIVPDMSTLSPAISTLPSDLSEALKSRPVILAETIRSLFVGMLVNTSFEPLTEHVLDEVTSPMFM